MAEKIPIASLDIDTEALITKATETKKVIDELRDSQKGLKKIGEQNSRQFVKNEIELKKLSSEYGQQKNVLTKLTSENNRFIKSEEALSNAINKEIKSIEVARKNNKDLLAIRNKINLSTENGKKQLVLINKKLDDNNKFIKENVSAYEQQKIGIGDYEGALRKVFPAGGQLIDVLKQMKTGLVAQKTAMKGATVGTSGLTKASKLLRIALISTGIGAIVVAVGALIAAFTSTQKGADAVSRALAPIKGAFEGIIGVIQNISLNVFSQLGDRFTIVSGNILNGIDKIRLGWNKLSGDTKEAEMLQARISDRTKDIADATVSLEKKTSDFVKILSEAPSKIKESAKAQVQVVDLQRKIEESEIRLIKQRAISMRIIKEQNKIAEDVNKSQSERESAAKKAIAESEKLLGFEQAIVDLKIKKTKISQTQNDTDREGRKELAVLEAERENAKTTSLEMQTTLQNKLNTIKSQIASKEAKVEKDRIDKIIENADKELQVFTSLHQKKIEANKFFNQKMYEDELFRLQEIKNKEENILTVKLENGAISQSKYNEAIKKIDDDFQIKKDETEAQREEAKKEQRIVDLANKRTIDEENFLSDYEIKLQRLNLGRQAEIDSAVKTGASKSIINDKYEKRRQKLDNQTKQVKMQNALTSFQGISDLLGKQSAIGKSVALIQAGINVQEGVTKAIAQGGLAGIASGVIVAAKGIQAVKKIASSDSPKFEKGGVIGGKRHSSGGTKFVGDDGTRFEAEKGEYIGVMSRSATEKFMQFNDANTPSNAFTSSMRLGNTFESGGIVNSISSSVKEPSQSSSNIAKIIASEINKIKVVTVVDDVTSLQGIKSEIIDGANI